MTMTDKELDDYIQNLMVTFHGDLTELSNALGALSLGRVYGWRVIRLIFSARTYRKYQKVLGLEFKKVLPGVTEHSERSYGFKMAVKLNQYWDIVRGVVSFDSKQRVLSVG